MHVLSYNMLVDLVVIFKDTNSLLMQYYFIDLFNHEKPVGQSIESGILNVN